MADIAYTFALSADTSPLVMVVGGYSDHRVNQQGETEPGLINDVELLSVSPQSLSKTLSYKNMCSKYVWPITANYYNINGRIENEAEVLGGVGLYTKGSPMFCGGRNGDGDQAKCYQWEYQINR